MHSTAQFIVLPLCLFSLLASAFPKIKRADDPNACQDAHEAVGDGKSVDLSGAPWRLCTSNPDLVLTLTCIGEDQDKLVPDLPLQALISSIRLQIYTWTTVLTEGVGVQKNGKQMLGIANLTATSAPFADIKGGRCFYTNDDSGDRFIDGATNHINPSICKTGPDVAGPCVETSKGPTNQANSRANRGAKIGSCIKYDDAQDQLQKSTVEGIDQAMIVLTEVAANRTNGINKCHYGIAKKVGGQEFAGGCWGTFDQARDVKDGKVQFTCPYGT